MTNNNPNNLNDQAGPSTDPSVVFGQSEALWVYKMAESIGGSSQMSPAERAKDAVLTALSHRQEEGLTVAPYIDIDQATEALFRYVESRRMVDDKGEK